MVCPSCGKHVAGAEALCSSCEAAVKNGVTAPPDALPPAGGGAMPGAPEDRSRQRRDANACLLLGILSFATLPAVFALGFLHDMLILDKDRVLVWVIGGVMAALIFSSIPTGVLAVVRGRRANQAIRRVDGRIFGDDRATPGMVLGAVGAGLWSLLIVGSFFVPKYRIGEGVSAVGTLRTINTAAIIYSCLYGGFPLKLSNLGIDPSKKGKTSDQAAGLIDEILASGSKGGYPFYYVAGPVDSQGKVQTYTVHADPLKSRAGEPHYYTDQSGVLRQELKRQADANSPIIGQGWGGGNNIDCREELRLHHLPAPSPPAQEGKIHVVGQ